MNKFTLGTLAALSMAMFASQAGAANLLYYSLPAGVKVKPAVEDGGTGEPGNGNGGGTTPTDPSTPDDASLRQPGTVAFGNVLVGDTAQRSVIIEAVGTKGTLAVGGFKVSNSAFVVEGNDCPANLQAGHSCTVTLSATPTADGALTDALTFNAGSAASVPITMNGQSRIALGGVSLTDANAEKPFSTTAIRDALDVRFEQIQPNTAIFSLAGGSLPAGVSLSSNGTLSGTPTTNGTYAFTVKVNYKGQEVQRGYTLSVTAPLADDAKFSASPFVQLNMYQGQTTQEYGYISVLGESGKVVFGNVMFDGPMAKIGDYDGCSGTTRYVKSGICEIQVKATGTQIGNFTEYLTLPTTNGKGTVSMQVYVNVSQPFQLGNGHPSRAKIGGYYNDTFLRDNLSVQEGYDAGMNADAATWTITSGALPPGMTLDGGAIYGSVSPMTSPNSYVFTVRVAYKGAWAENDYSIFVER